MTRFFAADRRRRKAELIKDRRKPSRRVPSVLLCGNGASCRHMILLLFLNSLYPSGAGLRFSKKRFVAQPITVRMNEE